MSDVKPKSEKALSTDNSITSVFGSIPVLPGESAEEYQLGLQSVIQELEAKTAMQVYLAEKIFECLWWMRRYEQQNRATIALEMTKLLSGARYIHYDEIEYKIMDMILDPTRRNELKKRINRSNETESSLMQRAFESSAEQITKNNAQIVILAKTLSGFQVSYEVLANRKLNIERLRLQNALLSRDLNAIEMETLPDASHS